LSKSILGELRGLGDEQPAAVVLLAALAFIAPAVDQARLRLQELMSYSVEQIGRKASLTDAIVAVLPRDPARKVLDHPFNREFMLTPVDDREAQQFPLWSGRDASRES
jgi:hypothetical protein